MEQEPLQVLLDIAMIQLQDNIQGQPQLQVVTQQLQVVAQHTQHLMDQCGQVEKLTITPTQFFQLQRVA